MKTNLLQNNCVYLVQTPSIRGAFRYTGIVDKGSRKYLFQLFNIDLYLDENEVMLHVHEDKRQTALDELTKQAQELNMGY